MVKPGYKQTDLGLLPEEWACREIGSFADVCMCKRIFAEQTTEMGEIPFYKIGTFGKKADAYISRPLFEEYKQKYSYPQKGDVLISAAGTLGRTVVYDGEEAYFQDSNIVWLDIDKSQISNDYLYHYYKVIKWTPSEGSTIARLYNGIITSTNVAVPPKPEQEAIAEALTDIDTLIVNLEKLIAKKKAIKQGAMQELLTGKRRLPGFDGEWADLIIGQNGYLLREPIDPQAYVSTLFWEYSMPAFDMGKEPVKTFGADMHSNRTVIHGSVLLFNKLNVRQKRIWLVEASESNSVCSSEFLPYYSDTIDLRLLAQLLSTEKITKDFIGMSTGTSNSQKRITPKNFLEYSVYMPTDINEQAAIADVLDAPSCTYLYIDKTMHDHGLFQAICRVNRLDGEDKDFGYIVDYKQLFGDLSAAMEKYTSGAFEGYADEDVEGLLKDRKAEAQKRFEKILDELDELCEGVQYPKDERDYLHYFCGENGVDVDNDEAYARMRERLYRLVNALIRAYAEVKPMMGELGYSATQQEQHDKTVNFYIALKATIGRASGDFIDLKAYEPGMRYLIDNYIVAEDARIIGDFDDFTLLDFILAQRDKMEGDGTKSKEQESAAEAIENNIRKKVVEKIVLNPKYYEKMSAVLEQLILERKQGVITYTQLLEKYIELARNVTKPEENESYPEKVRHSAAMRALYDNTGCDADLAAALHAAVMRSKMDRFRNDPVKERRIKRELLKILKTKDEVERVFKIIVEQEEY